MVGIKKKTTAVQILKAIALSGMVVVAMSSPYFGLGVLKGIKNYNDKKTWRKFYNSLHYLKRRGYVKINNHGDQLNVVLTKNGKKIFETVNIETMEIQHHGNWDKKWRIVIFDVPNTKSKNRIAFSQKLRNLGFIMVQKSVWAYPYECYKEIAILRKFYEIEKFVSYFETIKPEDEIIWRGKFNLLQT